MLRVAEDFPTTNTKLEAKHSIIMTLSPRAFSLFADSDPVKHIMNDSRIQIL